MTGILKAKSTTHRKVYSKNLGHFAESRTIFIGKNTCSTRCNEMETMISSLKKNEDRLI